MAIMQYKKYKTIKNELGEKIQVFKSKEQWDKETCGGTKTYYFSTRYKINGIVKQYKSCVYALKREASEEERLFIADPTKYIQEHSKRAKNNIEIIKNDNDKILNDYFNDFVEYKTNYIKGSSIYTDKRNWELYIKNDFENLTPKEINLSKIQLWHEKANKLISKKTNKLYATKTKNTWHTTLSEFLRYLYMNGLIEINYAKVIGCFKNPNANKNERKEIRYQTEEQFNLFMSVVDEPFWYNFFNFLFWHGCRKGEQRAIKIKDVQLNYNSIVLDKTFSRTKNGGENVGSIKNGKIRKIFLAKQSKEHIETLINFYKQMPGYNENWFLFGGHINTNKNRIERKLNYYYDKLEEKYPNQKINRLTHHEFGRHSHASYLLAEGLKKGLTLEEIYAIIAQRLGDTIEVIKSTYAHLYEKENNDKAKNILN